MFRRLQPSPPKEKVLLFEVDERFTGRYERGVALTETPDSGPKRRARFYNTVNFLRQTDDLMGSVAECGCWKGLSSYLLCSYMRDAKSGFRGEDYYVFDSFEGLSAPTPEDAIKRSIVLEGRDRNGKPLKPAGSYAASLDSVRRALSDFPEVTLIKGWLPQALDGQPERTYRFVHIDLDLYDPIKGTMRYFLPRMVNGGFVVCDDYGSLFWPGAKQAFDEVAAEFNLRVISLSSGQGILIAR